MRLRAVRPNSQLTKFDLCSFTPPFPMHDSKSATNVLAVAGGQVSRTALVVAVVWLEWKLVGLVDVAGVRLFAEFDNEIGANLHHEGIHFRFAR
ncbi:hypothetical protein D3C87_1693880 [compost metagenome]